MKNALLILLLLTPALFADKKPKRNVTVKDSSPTGIKTDVDGHLMIDASGIVTLTKKGQRASYNVLSASREGELYLGLDAKADEGVFKIKLAKGTRIRLIRLTSEAQHEQFDAEAIAKTFTRHDANSDGIIDPNELKKAGVQAMFMQRYDINNDGRISKKEQKDYLKSNSDRMLQRVNEAYGTQKNAEGCLVVESTGIVKVWADSWPPPKTENDSKANVLILKGLNSGISSGKIKLKKPR